MAKPYKNGGERLILNVFNILSGILIFLVIGGVCMAMPRSVVRLILAGLVATGLYSPGTAHAAADRPWNLTLRSWGGYDTNVAQVSTNDTTFDTSAGKSSTTAFGLMLAGDYRLMRGANWQVSANGSALQTLNADAKLNDFNLTTFSPGLAAKYDFGAGGKPARLVGSFGMHWDYLGGHSYAMGENAGIDVSIKQSMSSEFGLFTSFAHSNFKDDGLEPERSSRDGNTYRSGLRATKAFNRNHQAIMASASWVQNRADGANFDYRGPAASLQLVSYLYGPWAGALSFGYVHAEYYNYTVEPKRESNNYNTRLSIYGPLTRKLSADVSVGWNRSEADPEAFRSDRINVTAGVTYAF